jgi:hypothetical protein
MRKLRMTIGTVVLEAELNNTVTADALFKAAPFESSANTWGDEVYFSTPAQVGEEPEARTVMQPGELAYWPPGHAIAIGFGPTPASRGNEIRLASPCNVWGTAVGDVKQLKAIRPGAEIKVEGIK